MPITHSLTKSAILFIAACFLSSTSQADSPTFLIGVGHLGATLADTEVEVDVAGIEFRVAPKVSLQLRVIDFEYEYEDGDDDDFYFSGYYEYEKGEGTGLEFAVQFFPSETGFYLGGGIGTANSEYTYVEYDYGYFEAYSDEQLAYEIFFRAGYQFLLGPIYVTPQVQVGDWFNIGDTARLYGAFGAEIGFAF